MLISRAAPIWLEMNKDHNLTRAEIDEALDKLGPAFPPGDTKANATDATLGERETRGAKAPPLAKAAAGAPAPANPLTPSTREPRKAHPYADTYPLMTPEEFAALVADVKKHGVRDPIVVTKDNLTADGRNRDQASAAASVDCPFMITELEGEALYDWIDSRNTHRRHLTTSQRAAVAAEQATLRRGGDQSAKMPNGMSQAAAAKRQRVSTRTVGKAVAVKKASLELHEDVKTGKVTLAAAAKAVATKKPKKTKAAAATEGVADTSTADAKPDAEFNKKEAAAFDPNNPSSLGEAKEAETSDEPVEDQPVEAEDESVEIEDDYKDVLAVLVNLDTRIAANKPPRKLINALDRAYSARERYRPALSRPQQWQKAIDDARSAFEELESLRQAYEEIGENAPENLRDSPFAQKCEEIAQLDFSAPDVLDDAEGVDLPRGFGKD